jgi:hypothetical protein
MSEHLPECQPKTAPEPPLICICPELVSCEERVRESWYEVQSETWVQGYAAALSAVREAVEAIPAPYKMREDYETFGPYHEGKADMKDLCISAIDALNNRSNND